MGSIHRVFSQSPGRAVLERVLRLVPESIVTDSHLPSADEVLKIWPRVWSHFSGDATFRVQVLCVLSEGMLWSRVPELMGSVSSVLRAWHRVTETSPRSSVLADALQCLRALHKVVSLSPRVTAPAEAWACVETGSVPARVERQWQKMAPELRPAVRAAYLQRQVALIARASDARSDALRSPEGILLAALESRLALLGVAMRGVAAAPDWGAALEWVGAALDMTPGDGGAAASSAELLSAVTSADGSAIYAAMLAGYARPTSRRGPGPCPDSVPRDGGALRCAVLEQACAKGSGHAKQRRGAGFESRVAATVLSAVAPALARAGVDAGAVDVFQGSPLVCPDGRACGDVDIAVVWREGGGAGRLRCLLVEAKRSVGDAVPALEQWRKRLAEMAGVTPPSSGASDGPVFVRLRPSDVVPGLSRGVVDEACTLGWDALFGSLPSPEALREGPCAPSDLASVLGAVHIALGVPETDDFCVQVHSASASHLLARESAWAPVWGAAPWSLHHCVRDGPVNDPAHVEAILAEEDALVSEAISRDRAAFVHTASAATSVFAQVPRVEEESEWKDGLAGLMESQLRDCGDQAMAPHVALFQRVLSADAKKATPGCPFEHVLEEVIAQGLEHRLLLLSTGD